MLDTADVVVVGTGVAGLFCALNLPRTAKVVMLTKDQCENCDSFLAQGGICTLRSPEDYNSFFEDTMRAGHYENNAASVELMLRGAPEVISDIVGYGVEFDKEDNGEYQYTREGAHSAYRILHHDDLTGREITEKLLKEARGRENIEILEYAAMVDLMVKDDRAVGVVMRYQGELMPLYARAVVLATGGIGGLFKNSTNFRHITADALAIALIRGIKTQDVSYIQIHPTALYSNKPGRRFLISESVRGEGAVLLNKAGERFTDELKPRDVVSAAIHRQMEKDGMDHVYLSVTHLNKEMVPRRFPNIYKKCLEEGYDLTKEPIPVTPAQHYYMGGILSGGEGQTSLTGLYAVGEAGCNGVHGRNRLASNSLLESLVFSKRAALQIGARLNGWKAVLMKPELKRYEDQAALKSRYKQVIFDEIRRKDEAFYDQWCDDEDIDG